MKTTNPNDVEKWLDELNSADIEWKDGAHLREVVAARVALDDAERALRSAIRKAHDNGNSWAAIGMMLGISRQAAHRKYAEPSGGDATDG
ncbi:hypothetical protein ACFWN7_11050 [Agromyces sp. NPDC058484]|uniref:hypothetical protein n=1 Tax=Agromyces sp. NPDC058484 TaxID=3346524 RepID=UPI003660079C